MQAFSRPNSVFHRLKRREIACETALQVLVNAEGMINFDGLDAEVNQRFFRQLSDRAALPPVIPLLLWQNCYYLGCPVTLSFQERQQLRDRLNAEVCMIAINEKSYHDWFCRQNLNTRTIAVSNAVDPFTGNLEQEDITQTTEFHLAQTESPVGRITAIIAGALRNRASNIHLEPSPAGLRVRYRIDGILRHITTLPPEMNLINSYQNAQLMIQLRKKYAGAQKYAECPSE